MPNFNLNGSLIDVAGLGLGDCRPVITFPSGLIPSGQPGAHLEAALIQINATFGFNTTPHSFATTWVPTRDDPKAFHGASGQAPSVGRIIGFTIGEFLVSGEITHSEYNITANGGTVLNINIADTRRQLDSVRIITEDLGPVNPGSGAISIARAIRIIDGFEDLNGQISEEKFKEYRKILEQGATYPQIVRAIQLAVDQNEIRFDINKIPTVAQLEANLGGTASAIRFQFDATPLSEVVTRVLEATAYDWYWSMSEQAVKLVNRRVPFSLRESDLLNIVSDLGAASGLDHTIQLGYGDDLIKQARRVRLLGAHQEGWINSPILAPLDGLDTPASGIVFQPAWTNFSVQFTDSVGILRSYKPSDLELKAALKGIEHWTYFKKYQSAPLNLGLESPGFGLAPDIGSIAAQHPDFQSRIDPAMPLSNLGGNESGQIRLINNRRDAAQNWVLNFYNRVADHAKRFYGRAYIASGILVSSVSGAFKLANSAWGNVENQIEGQPLSIAGSSGQFVNDYEINRDLSPLAPFKGTDDKISAYVVLPSGTVYGPEGDESPAGFGQWTEDFNIGNTPATSGRRWRTGEHYLPITLTEVGQLTIDPRDPLRAFEEYPEGTLLAELPIIAGSGMSSDFIFRNLVTLAEQALDSTSSGLADVVDPSLLIAPYLRLSGVAIPILSPTRYGMSFPSVWVSGQLLTDSDAESIVIDEQFGPWNFPPQGTNTSLQIMEDRAMRRLQGLIAPAATSTFAQVEVVGMPTISFDGFSNNDPDASGRIGIRNHGITDVNFSLGSNGIRCNYRVASFFAQFGQEAPLGERQRAILNGIINPIDVDVLQLTPSTRTPSRPTSPFVGGGVTSRGEVTRKVTITTVNNALTFTNTPDAGTQERYRGLSDQDYNTPPVKPGSTDPDFMGTGGAICVDGFLNIGDEAIYHVNEFKLENGRRETARFFTGGRAFANGIVVFVSGIGSLSDVYEVAIANTDPVRRLVDVPLLNGAVNIGELTTLVSEAGEATPRTLGRPETSLVIDGIYLNPGGSVTIPVQVISITNPGTSGAIVSVRELNSRGDVNTAATLVTGLIPIPFPEFVIVGDKGSLFSTAVLNVNPSTPGDGSEIVGNFFFSNRQNFLKFT
jgi:hypothetical protein